MKKIIIATLLLLCLARYQSSSLPDQFAREQIIRDKGPAKKRLRDRYEGQELGRGTNFPTSANSPNLPEPPAKRLCVDNPADTPMTFATSSGTADLFTSPVLPEQPPTIYSSSPQGSNTPATSQLCAQPPCEASHPPTNSHFSTWLPQLMEAVASLLANFDALTREHFLLRDQYNQLYHAYQQLLAAQVSPTGQLTEQPELYSAPAPTAKDSEENNVVGGVLGPSASVLAPVEPTSTITITAPLAQSPALSPEPTAILPGMEENGAGTDTDGESVAPQDDNINDTHGDQTDDQNKHYTGKAKVGNESDSSAKRPRSGYYYDPDYNPNQPQGSSRTTRRTAR